MSDILGFGYYAVAGYGWLNLRELFNIHKGDNKMQRIAKFEKVSFEQFLEGWNNCFGETAEEEVRNIYNEIKLPKRATSGSAGYDFYSTLDFELPPNETIMIPTGIRAKIDDGWVLCLFPRSGLGFKFRLQLNNTVGIIDSDYYNSDNEGHIFVKLTNDTNMNKTVSLSRGDGFAQGLFMPFGITTDDEADGIRNGGFGSTTKVK